MNALWMFLLPLPAILYLRWVSPQRLLRRAGARPVDTDPGWRAVRRRLEGCVKAHRVPMPCLWVMPEFSPNAMVMRPWGRAHLAVTEGMIRALSEEELDTAFSLCLTHAYQRGRSLQTWVACVLHPLASALQSYPLPVQILCCPFFSALLRLVARPGMVLRADGKAAAFRSEWQVVATLQKLSVMGKKIPLRRWNLAVDSLFLVSPLALDEGLLWSLLSQPTVEERRQRLLRRSACESAPSLP